MSRAICLSSSSPIQRGWRDNVYLKTHRVLLASLWLGIENILKDTKWENLIQRKAKDYHYINIHHQLQWGAQISLSNMPLLFNMAGFLFALCGHKCGSVSQVGLRIGFRRITAYVHQQQCSCCACISISMEMRHLYSCLSFPLMPRVTVEWWQASQSGTTSGTGRGEATKSVVLNIKIQHKCGKAMTDFIHRV